MEYKIKSILKDTKGSTIGAIVYDSSNVEKKLRTDDILTLKKQGIKLRNAIIDSKGFVRSKSGKLPVLVVKGNVVNAVENREIVQVKKLLTQDTIKIYHGSKDENLVPKYGIGKVNNDYGRGFYTTPDKELAKEWSYTAYSDGSGHYCYSYELDIKGLKILDFTELDSMHWIAELLTHRKIDRINDEEFEPLRDNLEKLFGLYKLDTTGYDIIVGYRADDKYFQFVQRFISNLLYKEALEKALRFGALGIQVCVKSKKAFSALESTGVESVDEKYRTRVLQRDKLAEKEYKELIVNGNKSAREKIVFSSILAKEGE